MTLREQLKQEMVRQGMDHCDVVEFVINPKRVITALSEDNPVLNEDIEVLEIRLWPNYADYLVR